MTCVKCYEINALEVCAIFRLMSIDPRRFSLHNIGVEKRFKAFSTSASCEHSSMPVSNFVVFFAYNKRFKLKPISASMNTRLGYCMRLFSFQNAINAICAGVGFGTSMRNKAYPKSINTMVNLTIEKCFKQNLVICLRMLKHIPNYAMAY